MLFETRKLKHSTQLVQAKSSNPGSELPFVGLENITSWTGDISLSVNSAPEGTVTHFAPGDILFGKLRPYLAKVALPGFAGTCSTELLVLRPAENVEPRFLRYVLSSREFIDEVDSSTYGAKMPRASWEFIGSRRLPVPDLATQKAIADFLDRETARIDQLIEKKQRLVESLEEKLSAEIDQILLGSVVEQKIPVQGDEFVTEIPATWQMRRLKSLCSHLGNGFVGPTRDILIEDDSDGSTPYIQSTHIKNRRIEFERKPYFVERSWLASKPKARVATNDLLIVQTGDCGATAIVDEQFDGAGCHALIVARPIESQVEPRLLLHLLSSRLGRSKLARIQTGALHPHLEVGFVKDVAFPLPPRDEHGRLVSEIEQEISSIERIRSMTSTSISLLTSLRASLITAAVTGQLDIAAWSKRGETERRIEIVEAAV